MQLLKIRMAKPLFIHKRNIRLIYEFIFCIQVNYKKLLKLLIFQNMIKSDATYEYVVFFKQIIAFIDYRILFNSTLRSVLDYLKCNKIYTGLEYR